MEAASGGEHHPAAEPRAVAAAADDAASVLDLACVLSRVLPALPPDSRARAACVRRAWRTAAADPAAWAELDFRSCAGRLPNWRPLLLPVPQPYPPSLVVDKTLAALCARAGAALRTLRCDTDVCGGVTVEGILAALRGGGCVGVRHLAVRQDYYRYPERFRDQQAQRRLGGVFGPPQGVGPPLLTLETARELLAACPLLEHAALVVSAGVADSAEVAAALPGPLSVVLRREGAEAPLRDMLLSSVTKLDLTFYDDDFGDVGALALAQALRVNVALTVLKLEHINNRGGCKENNARYIVCAFEVANLHAETPRRCRVTRYATSVPQAQRVDQSKSVRECYCEHDGNTNGWERNVIFQR